LKIYNERDFQDAKLGFFFFFIYRGLATPDSSQVAPERSFSGSTRRDLK
jgi:hypothetical protein